MSYWKNKVFALLAGFVLFSFELAAQTRLPANWSMLAGTERGLSVMDGAGRTRTIWQGGAVRKILPLAGRLDNNKWALLSDKGVLVSADLVNWEERSNGLPVKTLKVFEEGRKSFLSVMAEIKDLEVHPKDSNIMVCAVKDGVYLTRDGGMNWRNLGMPPYNSNGIKAVAVFEAAFETEEGELTVFCSHGIYGVYYFRPGRAGAVWTELNAGLEKLETTDNPDEISDMAAFAEDFQDGGGTALYVSQTFRPRIYRFNWEEKRFERVWSGGAEFGTADSLWAGNGGLSFLREGEINELVFSSRPATAGQTAVAGQTAAGRARARMDFLDKIKRFTRGANIKPLCAVFSASSPAREPPAYTSLSELWLLDAAAENTGEAASRRGLYLPVNHAMENRSLKPYLDLIEDRGLDMVVIDMKDDYGRLRFTPRNKSLENWGRVFWPVDIDAFLKEMKSRGIYTAARVVVFKDPEAAKKQDAKYAVWDGRRNKAWAGYYDTRREKTPPDEESESPYVTELLPADDPAYEILRTYYDERWVDPYAEEYWEYIAALSEELAARGFDEIQFDYIRFPTDGVNLSDARYRWRENNMDMDSAIISFLRHIRSRVKLPVSVDIYGANGWYRTGARTGQEVELLSSWVDVICPMYYPSHFEQDFLAQEPPELRPQRIYYQGTLRTARIARGKVVVRPWVQAFYLNVSYDRRFYNPDYVRREIEGTEAAGSGGYTHWNNSGRYDDIPRASGG